MKCLLECDRKEMERKADSNQEEKNKKTKMMKRVFRHKSNVLERSLVVKMKLKIIDRRRDDEEGEKQQQQPVTRWVRHVLWLPLVGANGLAS